MSQIAEWPITDPQWNDTKLITLQKILQVTGSGGGGSGSGSQEVYQGAAPPAAPDDPTKPAVFYPNGGGSQQQWDVPSQAWV